MKVDEENGKPGVSVDEHEDLQSYEVLQSQVLSKDGTANLYYDCVMIKIDVKASYYGNNVFYVI